MQVIATARGFDGRVVREKGEEFDMPDDAFGSWFEPTEARAKKAAEKAQRIKDAQIAAEVAADADKKAALAAAEAALNP